MGHSMSNETMHRPNKTGGGGYRLLDPRQKYNRAFCTEEEIDIAVHIREFVDRELMPYRHDLEGGGIGMPSWPGKPSIACMRNWSNSG